MLTLGSYLKELRGERRQEDIARDAGIDPSLISMAENDTHVRPASLKKIRKGLKAKEDEWETIKLLWLQQRFNEPIYTRRSAKAREVLALKENTDAENFLSQLHDAAQKHLPVINKNNLQGVILDILKNPKLLTSLKQFHDIAKALTP